MVGKTSDSLDLAEHATLGDVLKNYERACPSLKSIASSLAMSINQEYAGLESKVSAGDEIALLPPVSGGQDGPHHEPAYPSRPQVLITRQRIDPQTVLANLKRPQDGAAVVFEGVVRDHTRGRRTLYLDYEAYEEMALKRMGSLAEQALERFAIRDVAIVHRLGRLQIGETSVLIVVASAHRAAAFDACRWLIDTLKQTLPIWKKEYFEDGAVWAEGEPFPEGIRVEGSYKERLASK